MALKEDIDSFEEIEEVLTNNKVANFCYTQEAYDTDDADSVDEYDFEAEQNIPSATAEVLNLDPEVLDKGFRSQASSMPRMSVNHFFGRVSYNLNKTVDNFKALLTSLKTYLGAANGIATLDSNGRLPYSQLPESAMEFMGTWDASTNTPHIEDGVGTNGSFYIVDVGGQWNGINFFVNDRIIYNGSTSTWKRLEGNAPKAPKGFIYQQLYNPTRQEWEDSPEDLYPENSWELITEDFIDYPFFKATYSETLGDETVTGVGHNAEHTHGMNHKHRMEHSHSMNHTHQSNVWLPLGSAATTSSNLYSMICAANNRGGRVLSGTSGSASTDSTGSSSYSNSYTGEAKTLGSTTTSTATDITRAETDASGTNSYPEPNWCGKRIWKCVG